MQDCIFCKINADSLPSHTVYEDEMFKAILDINPVKPGHTLIVTKEHYETIFDLPEYLLEKTAPITKHVAEAVRRGTGATGINIQMNNGRSAGQVVDHAHIHIIPRRADDGLSLWEGHSYADAQAEQIAENIRNAF